MIKDGQVRKLRSLLASGASLAASARKSDMDEKTARKYRDLDGLPSERRSVKRSWRTREDPFLDVWAEVEARLSAEPGLRAFALFGWLQDQYPNRFPDSQRRTFERRVRDWRGSQGPAKDVMFPQVHHPGDLAASDFTNMNSLRIMIGGQPFEHLLYHLTLTYSNWESVAICYSESFEAFSHGFQKAMWELGGVPRMHRSDSLSAAVNNLSDDREFRKRYQDLMDYYRIEPQRINVRKAHENGDVESSHGHLKRIVEQALLLRGSRNFSNRHQYEQFLEELIAKRNASRVGQLQEERQHLGTLPLQEVDYRTRLRGIKVRSSSTIQVKRNVYSVHSRLIGHTVDVVIDVDCIEVWHADTLTCRIPRLIGIGKHSINYRHVIDSLVRKPGAFENYLYREDLFPSSHFRIAYDLLCRQHAAKVAAREYLRILQLAAKESQDAVQDALRVAINAGDTISFAAIRTKVQQHQEIPLATDVKIAPPNLDDFDQLLQNPDMEVNSDGQEDDNEDKANGSASQGHENDDSESDDSIPRSASSNVPRELCNSRRTSNQGGDEPHRVLGRVDRPGVPSETPESHCKIDATVEVTNREDLGQFRLETLATSSEPPVRKPSRRNVPRSSREPAGFWQAGFGEEPLSFCIGRATGAARTVGPFHNLQFVGATIIDCQAGLAFS